MALDVCFRALPTWPGKATVSKLSLPGEQSYGQILDRLEKELAQLRARDIVIETGHRPEDIRNDGWIRSNARIPSHPGVVLYFDAMATRAGKQIGPMRYALDQYRTWQDNLRALVLTLEALRSVDRYGATTHGEQYRGYAALPPAPQGADRTTATRTILRAALGCEPAEYAFELAITNGVDQSTYNVARRNSHPDVTGDRTNFDAVTAAWDILTKGEKP